MQKQSITLTLEDKSPVMEIALNWTGRKGI
jgi:hypothetical protein